MKDCILTITLNPAIDKTVKVAGFRVGDDFRTARVHLSAGGKGINASQVLKRLGAKTIASGFLAGPWGEYIDEKLTKDKIRHSFVKVGGNTRVSLTIIDPKLNTITRVLEPGPTVGRRELVAFRKRYLSLLKGCRAVILSGRSIPGAPDSFYAELIALAKRKGVLTVFDSSGKPYELGLNKKPFMIKPNWQETEQIMGRRFSNPKKLQRAVGYFHRRGIKIVTISMGSRGVIASNGIERVLAVPPKVVRKNPVGCGDAFIAGFIFAWCRGKGLAESARLGVACGAANAVSINPGYIEKKTLNRLLGRVSLKAL